MIQAGHPESGLPFLSRVDSEAITEDFAHPRNVHKWEMETLVSELLTVAKRNRPLRGQWRQLDCRRYDAFVDIINKLRNLEDAEAGLRLKRINVLREMPRIMARQADWQRGWFNVPQFYRSTFIYGQSACASYFEETHGLTINQFSLIGFGLYVALCDKPIVLRSLEPGPLPFTKGEFATALKLLCLPINDARRRASSLHRPRWPIAYQPSVLRQYPCIDFGPANERIRAPLPQLILERVTAGIFYDVAAAGPKIREDYGRRFEEYSLQLLRAMLPEVGWRGEAVYNVRREEFKSPDILWNEADGLRLVIECKATRMSLDARYADDPLAERGYGDLIKAVFQLWRYFSHCRRGLAGEALRGDVRSMVLTLDNWLVMANDLTRDVLEAATVMAAKRDPQILPEDRKPIVFCAMTDLESVLVEASVASFSAAVDIASGEDKIGWMLTNIHDGVKPDNVEIKRYPFREQLAQLLPWWDWARKSGIVGS